jgi:hypothetical protein
MPAVGRSVVKGRGGGFLGVPKRPKGVVDPAAVITSAESSPGRECRSAAAGEAGPSVAGGSSPEARAGLCTTLYSRAKRLASAAEPRTSGSIGSEVCAGRNHGEGRPLARV